MSHKSKKEPKKPLAAPVWSSRNLMLLGCALIVTFIAFYPSLRNGFTNWDDPGYVLEAYSIRDLSAKGLANIFTSYVEGNYHPLTMLSYAVEYHFVQLNPAVYHATNLLLHLINTALVFWLVHLLTGRAGTAVIASALFGIHPLHVESVAWISERKDVLFSLFFLGALISYVLSVKIQRRRILCLGISLILYLLSILAKGMAVTLPLLFLLVDYYLGRPFTAKTFAEKIPFFLLSVAFGIVAIMAQRSKGAIQDIALFPFYERVLFAFYGAGAYVYKLFLPLPLSAFYPYPPTGLTALPLIFYVAPVLVTLAALAVWRSARVTKDVLFGTLFFAVTVALVLQLLPVGSAIIADRYAYLPSIGIFFLIGQAYSYVGRDLSGRSRQMKGLFTLFLGGFGLWLGYLTWTRCEVWKDNVTLWTDVISKYPMVPVAYNNRALTYKGEGNYELAMADYNRALQVKPTDTEALSNRGNIYFATGRYDLALADMNKALEIDPGLPVTLNARGAVYFNQARYDAALADMDKAIGLKPDFPEAYMNRGNVYSVKKEFASAIRDYDRCLGFDPNQSNVLYWRGLAKSNTGDIGGALNDYDASLALNPRFSAAYYGRSRALFSQHDFRHALEDALRAKSLGFSVEDSYLAELRSAHPAQ